jgi:hypothetical protein
MVQMPTFRQFVDEARKHGVEEGKSNNPVTGPRGQETFQYLRRPSEPEVIVPATMHDDTRLTPGLLSYWMRRLKIPPEVFGLPLGFLDGPF